ncbi:MAG TPA: hypothetical protein DDY13_11905 [Cytophagales bacterium]|nr:hypothetical protein [Cytophagales bacterium]
MFLESEIKDREFLVGSCDVIKEWQKHVNNWGKCDALSKIFTKILEIIPDKVFEQLLLWNKSKNFWDTRLSLIISLLYFSKTKKVV